MTDQNIFTLELNIFTRNGERPSEAELKRINDTLVDLAFIPELGRRADSMIQTRYATERLGVSVKQIGTMIPIPICDDIDDSDEIAWDAACKGYAAAEKAVRLHLGLGPDETVARRYFKGNNGDTFTELLLGYAEAELANLKSSSN